jgi:hypothetical protein
MHTQAQSLVVAPSSTTNKSLSISVSGNATKIGNSTETASSSHAPADSPAATSTVLLAPSGQPTVTANAQIVATVIRSNNGTIMFNVTGTSLTIGTTIYNVVNGTGIFNQHSMIVVLHATVTNGSTTGHLILIGEVTGTASTEGSHTVNVSFGSPQSKLAASFFLSLDGTLTLS